MPDALTDCGWMTDYAEEIAVFKDSPVISAPMPPTRRAL